MAARNLEISFFTENDGNAMSIERRIIESLNLLLNADDYFVIEGINYYNELELRTLLLERGILN